VLIRAAAFVGQKAHRQECLCYTDNLGMIPERQDVCQFWRKIGPRLTAMQAIENFHLSAHFCLAFLPLPARVALLFPRIAVGVIAVAFPEAEAIVVEKLEAANPFNAFPSVEMGND
jgi:hypothetical protein